MGGGLKASSNPPLPTYPLVLTYVKGGVWRIMHKARTNVINGQVPLWYLTISNVRVEPGQPPEYPPEPGYPGGLEAGEADVVGQGPQEVLLYLLRGHQMVVGRGPNNLLVADLAGGPLGHGPGQPHPDVRPQGVWDTVVNHAPVTKRNERFLNFGRVFLAAVKNGK